MEHLFQASDYTEQGLLRPEAYQRWFDVQNATVQRDKCCALIMAGGKSSRMGTDKALLQVGGMTMLERSIRFWQSCQRIDEVLVSVGQPGRLEPLPEGVKPVYDTLNARGPMAGILAAFEQSDADVVYVSAVDMPNLNESALLPLPVGDAAVYRLDGRAEPLLGVYRRSIAEPARQLLQQGGGKMSLLLERVNTQYFDAPERIRKVFLNMNTPEELLSVRLGEPPMLAVMGWSGSGKTTFLEKLLPILTGHGLRIAVIKHDAHGFQMDQPGKDTYRMAEAGASTVGIIGPDKWALVGSGDATLEQMRRNITDVDLIIAEGFKYCHLPKIEVHRKATGKPPVCHDDTLLAAVTDEPLNVTVPQFALDDAQGCADLILKILRK